MSLARNPAEITADLAVARHAMEAGVWFHSSPTCNNGFTFMVLRHAFEADRSRGLAWCRSVEFTEDRKGSKGPPLTKLEYRNPKQCRISNQQ
jgi:hypothetical protein